MPASRLPAWCDEGLLRWQLHSNSSNKVSSSVLGVCVGLARCISRPPIVQPHVNFPPLVFPLSDGHKRPLGARNRLPSLHLLGCGEPHSVQALLQRFLTPKKQRGSTRRGVAKKSQSLQWPVSTEKPFGLLSTLSEAGNAGCVGSAGMASTTIFKSLFTKYSPSSQKFKITDLVKIADFPRPPNWPWKHVFLRPEMESDGQQTLNSRSTASDCYPPA